MTEKKAQKTEKKTWQGKPLLCGSLCSQGEAAYKFQHASGYTSVD